MPKKQRKKSKKSSKPEISSTDFTRFEFHRNGAALLPEAGDTAPGIALLIPDAAPFFDRRSCSCIVSKKRTCDHLLKLTALYRAYVQKSGVKVLDEEFRLSIWHRLASVMAEGVQELPDTVTLKLFSHNNTAQHIRVFGSEGSEIMSYLSQGPDAARFIQRCWRPAKDTHQEGMPTDFPEGGPERAQYEDALNRGRILDKLALYTCTENERLMMDRGFRSRRQALEGSFWYRLAYHCYREFGAEGCSFHPSVDEASGAFIVTCKKDDTDLVFHMVIPRAKVQRLLAGFKKLLPNQNNMPIHPIPLKSIFKVTRNTEMDLDVRPMIQLIQADGETRFYEREDLAHFRYGNLIYIKELGILAEMEKPGGSQREFRAPVKMIVKNHQIPNFLEEYGDDFGSGRYLVDATVEKLRIFRNIDRVEISPEAIDRDWCWLSVQYGFGNTTLSLGEILAAKQEGRRFIGTPEGWVDCQSPELGDFDALLNLTVSPKSKTMKLSRSDLYRLRAFSPEDIEFSGHTERVAFIKRLFELRPAAPLPEISGMTSTLRTYQKVGTQWIWFLYENGFGGLLCDDMGLGKTHQVMAIMTFLHKHEKVSDPFLVVCPTTVLSHWESKIRDHAPCLKTAVYHGGERDLNEATMHHVILTSFGILRRDIEQLRRIPLSLAVFDEIQHLKNSETLSYRAAEKIEARMKLGLTGTPIENTVSELKALMDLTVPGYLGTDNDFDRRYGTRMDHGLEPARREELRRLIYPFTLRRLKQTVLQELPAKIEDLRTCRLSDDQIKLYRDAIDARGAGLISILEDGSEPVPYIHIFALLNLLKQICNHPAMVEGSVADYQQYASGKWDLFQELIFESLDSGQKVVVYSQFLDMIRIMEHFFKEFKVGFVSLTGASRNRGEIISRFNTDPKCRVFVGSLKAGGTGIDLVAASVVIHYDRWWNAAKEDQATDRVHRIGQKRGVQVFKLVTQGTLEEKISAIIKKKKDLMDSIVKEDDANLVKSFSRQDLIEMLSVPQSF